MALFGRKRADGDPIDRIQDLAIAAFARHGVTGQLARDPDDPMSRGIIAADGKQFGLHNLFVKCLRENEKNWPGIIEGHVAAIVASMQPHDPVDLTKPETRAQLRSRILPPETRIDLSYARPFAPGLFEVLCLDQPQSVQTLDASMLTPDLDELYRIARENLRLEGRPTIHEVAPGLLAAEGPSFFTASRMVDPEFTARMFDAAPRGIVFSIPFRHVIFFHEVLGAASVETIHLLIRATRNATAEDQPGGPISPEVFYRGTDGTIQQITRLDDDGTIGVMAEGAFLDAINT